jgi:hypothetical protein
VTGPNRDPSRVANLSAKDHFLLIAHEHLCVNLPILMVCPHLADAIGDRLVRFALHVNNTVHISPLNKVQHNKQRDQHKDNAEAVEPIELEARRW